MTAGARPNTLVGRQEALALGDTPLPDVLAGRGRVLLVAGEAGIGKTTLPREIGRRAEAAGAVPSTVPGILKV